MPYLKFISVDNKTIELNGNNYNDFKNKLNGNTQLVAVPQAIKYVDTFFHRRQIQVCN